MEKFSFQRTKEVSFVISVLINALIFFFYAKLLNTVHFVKRPLEVVLLASNNIEENHTDLSIPKKITLKKINQKVLPNNNDDNKSIAQVNQKSIEKKSKHQIASANEIKTQDSKLLGMPKNATKDTQNQLSQVNQANPKRNLQAENKSENIVQTQNATQSISKADYAFLRQLIEKHLTYPYLARRNGYEGTVVVSFILQDATFKNISIVKSSGYPILDKSAIDAIKKIEPLVNINKDVKIIIPINFRLSDS